MPPKPSLKRTILASQTLVVLISILVVGSFWLFSRFLAFRQESAELKESFLASRKETLKNEIEKVADFM